MYWTSNSRTKVVGSHSWVRPWFVVDVPPKVRFIFPGAWIYRDTLGAAMLDAALNGGEPRVLENTALNARDQAALEKLIS